MNLFDSIKELFGAVKGVDEKVSALQAAQTELVEVKAKLTEAEAALKDRELSIIELTGKLSKADERVTALESEVAAAPEKIEKRASEIATEKLATAGSQPAPVAGDVADINSIIESYTKEKDPVKKARIYKEHRAEIEKKVLGH